MIASALAGAIDLGLTAGREELSSRFDSPPAKNRPSHFLAVVALTPCAAAAAHGVGEVRGLGVFWAIELVRDQSTREPLVPYNATGADAKPMAEVAAACKAAGLWPFTHFNRLHVVPPCNTSIDDVRQGLAIIDDALAVADAYCN